MASASNPFRRMPSLKLFKRKDTCPYQTWEDEDSLCDLDLGSPPLKPVVQFQRDYPLEFTDSYSANVHTAACSSSNSPIQYKENLLECFYLGSYEMTGLTIKGRGCIDTPAGHIWEQTQTNDKHKPRRKNSWTKQHHDRTVGTGSTAVTFNPRYVKLVAGENELEVYDNSTGELIIDFKYKTISFVGTHPKYSRLFAFIAQSSGKHPASAFCHAFKCESKESAKNTACALSDVFQRKIEELQAKKQRIEITTSVTVVN